MKKYSCILLILFFASCEYEAQISYQVKNNCLSSIKVISVNTAGKTSTDTFYIAPNDQTTIAVNGQGLGNVNKYKETNDQLRSFTKMEAFKSDTTKSVANFLKTDRWTYKEKDKHSADYQLTVSPTDF